MVKSYVVKVMVCDDRQIATSDMASLKEQLAAERQEKLNLLAKVAQLKSALKASMSHSKVRSRTLSLRSFFITDLSTQVIPQVLLILCVV